MVEASSAPAKSTGAQKIKKLNVTGGFLDGLKLDFHPGLNCIIGARGAGKTTILEIARFVLDLLSRDKSAATKLIARNLGEGTAALVIETSNGLSYRVSRMNDNEPVVTESNGASTELTPKSGFFKINIFSQNEVESIADSSAAQLALLDSFAPEDLKTVERKIAHIQDELRANASRMMPLRDSIEALNDELTALPSVQEQLKGFAAKSSADGEIFNKAHAQKALRLRETQAVGDLHTFLQSYHREIANLRGALAKQLGLQVTEELVEGDNGAVIRQMAIVVEQCAEQADDRIKQLLDIVVKAGTTVKNAGQQLRSAHAEQEAAFQKLLEKHKQLQGEAAQRAKLEKTNSELLAKQRLARTQEKELSELLTSRATLLAKLSEARDERFAIRNRVADRINAQLKPRITVKVIQQGNFTVYQKMLQDAFAKAGSNFRTATVQKIASTMMPEDLVTALRSKQVKTLIDRAGLSEEQARRVMTALADPTLLMNLEIVNLPDEPCISLKDGARNKPTNELSTGQKCTAILPILLLENEGPLWIDQPEDNLDNRFIFETVLESLRAVKGLRQIIFCTHSANLLVLADADRVFVMESNGERARLAKCGNVDECKEEIVTLLEGGEKAFKERKKRYNY